MQQEVKIVLLHTNDIHSSFDNMPRIAGTVARLRARHRDTPVLLADCGDHMDKMSSITEASEGEAHLRILEAMEYQYITLGNNEGLTFTKDRMEELFNRQLPFMVLGANLRELTTGEPPVWMIPSHIREQDGIRIGWIAVTAPYTIFYQLLGWQVDEPLAAVRREIGRIREQVDAIVVISHLGLRSDKQLAEQIEGIDIILGGHTHHVLEPPLVHGQTLLCGCGSLGRYVGELELYFDRNSRQLLRVEGGIHHTEHEAEDPGIKALIRSETVWATAVMEQQVAVLDRPLPVDWERDSPLGNLLAMGIRKQTGAEIGLINSGQLLTSLLAGPVTRQTLLALCPSPVNSCLVRLTGRELLTALEESLLDEFVQLPIYGNGFRGKRLGGLCVDGLTVNWNPQGEPYSRILQARTVDGLLEADREYLVGTADMFTFGTGYLSLKQGREPRYFLPDFLRHVLTVQLNNPGDMEACTAARFYTS